MDRIILIVIFLDPVSTADRFARKVFYKNDEECEDISEC